MQAYSAPLRFTPRSRITLPLASTRWLSRTRSSSADAADAQINATRPTAATKLLKAVFLPRTLAIDRRVPPPGVRASADLDGPMIVGPGRVAQWESAPLTRERSLVRAQPRPSALV